MNWTSKDLPESNIEMACEPELASWTSTHSDMVLRKVELLEEWNAFAFFWSNIKGATFFIDNHISFFITIKKYRKELRNSKKKKKPDFNIPWSQQVQHLSSQKKTDTKSQHKLSPGERLSFGCKPFKFSLFSGLFPLVFAVHWAWWICLNRS